MDGAAGIPGRVDAEWLLRQSGWVRGLAARVLRDAEGAEDVVQEAWLAALQGGGEVAAQRGPAGLRAWLASVTRNLALRRLQREAARREGERSAAREESVEAEGEWTDERMRARLADALLALEEPYRSALILRHVDGLPHRDVATRLKITEATSRLGMTRRSNFFQTPNLAARLTYSSLERPSSPSRCSSTSSRMTRFSSISSHRPTKILSPVVSTTTVMP